jgi:succinate dehydrogenase / fumarate reductase, cytochrome b subunit
MHWIVKLYSSSVGKKYLMAVTGIILFAFVVAHMLGNLQIFLGAERLNHYAALLQGATGLLWIARTVLLFCVGVHIVASVQLFLLNRRARPERYRVTRYRAADYSARTMVWSGPIVALFVVYHLLHLTLGTAHPSFVAADVYHNVVAGFRVWPVSAFYIAANLLLGYHLYHGLWSLFQSLGLSHPAYDRWRSVFAAVMASLIAAGNVSIPVAVLLGLVG